MDDKRIAAAEHKHLIPLDRINGYDVRPGFYGINGATALREGVNFTVCSVDAIRLYMVLLPFCSSISSLTEEKKSRMRFFLFPNITGSVECIPCSFLDWISLISNMPIG